MNIAYARISTDKQDLQRQLDKLNNHPEDLHIKTDVRTGTSTERKSWRYIEDHLEDIDLVVATSTSRISRSIADLQNIAEQFREAGTTLELIDEPITIEPNQNDPFQRAMFNLLGVFAELEADLIRERTRAGIQSAREQGTKWGTAPVGFTKDNGKLYPNEEYERLSEIFRIVDEGNMSKREASQRTGVSRATVKRAVEDPQRRRLYNLDPNDPDKEKSLRTQTDGSQ